MDTPRRVWRARLAALALALLLLVAGELALRGFGFAAHPRVLCTVLWSPETDARMAAGDDMHRPDARTLWSPRPGAAVAWGTDERVSPQGFRGADPDPAAALRVLVLGDSSSFGMGVAAHETYAALLERALSGQCDGEVQVVNAGVIGWTIIQGIARYRSVRATWRPHLVVAAFGTCNEQWPARGQGDAEKLASLAQAARARAWSALRERSRLAQLVASLLPRRGAGEPRPLEELFADPDYLPRVTPAEFDDALAPLAREVRADGGRLILVHMPRRASFEQSTPRVLAYSAALRAFASTAACPLVDGDADFRASGIDEAELLWDAYHPTARGHARLAELLGDVVLLHVDALRRER